MKIIVKQSLILAAALMVSLPAFAADPNGEPRAVTKGTKFYQTGGTPSDQEAPQAATGGDATGEDLQNIQPAAGAAGKSDTGTAGKSFKEELRLPRKN